VKEDAMKLLIGLGAVALMSCTASADNRPGPQSRADKELSAALNGRTAGKPQDCIDNIGLEGPQVIDGHTLLYRAGGQVVWRNDLDGNCPGLDSMATIVIVLHGSQICQHDMFHTINSGSSIPGPTCAMGKFTPYRK
jgi:hypothetical protein